MLTKTTLPMPTAKDINEAHRLARLDAESAVKNAIRCGELLAQAKAALKHGDFQDWVDRNCKFAYSTAARYMKVAGKSLTGVEISALRHLFPSGLPGAQKAREATPAPKQVEAPKAEPVATQKPAVTPESDAPERPEWEPEEDAALEAAERELNASNDKILRADDTTAAMHDEIKRQAAENAVLKMSRDGFMNGKTEMTRLLKAEQRKVEQLGRRVAELERENAKLVEEVDSLRERVAIMDAA